MILKITVLVLLLVLFFVGFRMWKFGEQSREMSPTVGLMAGALMPCPNKPNCVSSFADSSDEQHYIAPRAFAENPISKLMSIGSEMGFELSEGRADYLYFQAKSSLFGFIDDVEFYYDGVGKKLHYRSASRVGHSDMGANRKRLNKVIAEL